MKAKLILVSLFCATLYSCNQAGKSSPIDKLLQQQERFDTLINGKQNTLYTLCNSKMAVQITNYGGRIVSIIVPDKNNTPTDIVWGFESIHDYLKAEDVYAGPLVGRYGNRIAQGKFTINGTNYQVSINNGPNHLHGGKEGFWNKIWDGQLSKNDAGEDRLVLSYFSPDGEDGYPGNVMTRVTYTLKNDNALQIEYTATTDQPTPYNPTIHPYFNLHGTTSQSTNTHYLQVNASHYTPTDSVLIPTGEIAPVEGTPADFRTAHLIGDRTSEDGNDMMKFGGGGYDINFVLDKTGEDISRAATLYEPSNGIAMDILTDQPGLQFYSGGCINGTDLGKRGDLHRRYSGLALETQHFPDSPNHPNFPNTILNPEETYRHTVVFRFYTTDTVPQQH